MTIERLVQMLEDTNEQLESIRHLKNSVNADAGIRDKLTTLYSEKSGEPTEIIHAIDRIETVVYEHRKLLNDIVKNTSITWPPKCTQTND